MKFFFVAFLVVVISLALFSVFYGALRVRILNSLSGRTAAGSLPGGNANQGGSAGSPASQQPPKSVPPGFKGPTGQPHINGPKSNPPNY